jgi:predicted DNA-binding protein
MENKIQTSFKMDQDTHKGLKIMSAITGKSIQAILENLIKEYVQKNKPEVIK